MSSLMLTEEAESPPAKAVRPVDYARCRLARR